LIPERREYGESQIKEKRSNKVSWQGESQSPIYQRETKAKIPKIGGKVNPQKGGNMGVVNIKEINKYYRIAKWNFNHAIELAKKNIVVGEIHFAGSAMKVRTKKVKVISAPEGKEET
jgi:hypothetical protein